MITHTEKDKSLLLGNIIKLYDVESVGSLGAYYDDSLQYTYIDIRGESCQIDMNLLLKIIFYDPIKHPGLHKDLSRSFAMLLMLIHYIPLKRVPLFINIIPTVASWRLELGK